MTDLERIAIANAPRTDILAFDHLGKPGVTRIMIEGAPHYFIHNPYSRDSYGLDFKFVPWAVRYVAQ